MKMPRNIGPVHFVGIGGIGMSGIAEILHDQGYKVRGSDSAENPNVQRLRSMGIEVEIGQRGENLKDAAVVVISSAIKKGNPELAAARSRGLPVVRRAEMLAEIMRFKNAIAIGGTHGKTTTTTLVATLLDAGSMDPTVINGGIINAYGTNARLGEGEWMVVEADESDGTFVKLPADVAVGSFGRIEGGIWNIAGAFTEPVTGSTTTVPDATITTVDDVVFVNALVDELEGRLCIDPTREYVTGKSNGAGMSTFLACQPDVRFAAVAPVAEPEVKKPNRAGGDLWSCQGELPASDIRKVLGDQQASIRSCYERALRNDNQLQGSVELEVRIANDGKVSNTRVRGSLRDPEVSRCVQNLARNWVFHSPSGGSCAVFKAPYNFTPKN